MGIRKKGQVGPRFAIYLLGLLVMALGLVLLIQADLGATPWDVFHVGLFYQFGLTIGSWSIIVGVGILTVASLVSKEFPQIGAFLNMILVGIFIDMYLLIPFLETPDSLIGRVTMFVVGILLNAYGMGLYISAQFGAGPRDSLMIALTAKTGWKVRNVRAVMEVLVLLVGWQLGGPVFWGTILICLMIGPLAGICLPQCQRFTDRWLNKLKTKQIIFDQSQNDSKRGASL
ncbi:YczE/YyaS/YitT family protein [Robertmurraya kyonggiensis]|uniref:YitT family protein n=1 Tax=Robertmurraya kyonggiensis TaxID=1037680 RepID=A0A4U1DDF3_9BACI|nr:YitT family protein [Robertmurraya kyonggiensis]TKC20023.1 YitT family protein [Robertmurraya kyonggiensis]